MPTVRIRAIIRDIPPLPLSCNAYTLDEITLLLRFSYLWKTLIFGGKKKLTEFTFAVGETRVDDEMIPIVLEL